VSSLAILAANVILNGFLLSRQSIQYFQSNCGAIFWMVLRY